MTIKDSVEDYFEGKNVFITGGSGFIGKALIEKLLRSCPELGKIYILLRPKKGKTSHERIEQIVSSPLFDLLKKKHPEKLKKIVPIHGDTCTVGLGISEADRKLLRDEVNIFFHSAASVKFDDLIKDSIFANLRSARDAALLALEIKNIEVFVHISTSYCNIDNGKIIEEILYPAPQSWREAIEIAENCNPDVLGLITSKYIGEFPNTYVFTKRLAEHCINDLLVGKIRTIIQRPSIVVGSIEEPLQGWTDNFNGPIGLLVAGALGALRIVYADETTEMDFIPVDCVVKFLLISAWHKVNFGNIHELSIFHITKNDLITTKLDMFIKFGKQLYWEIPYEKKIWFPHNKATTNWYEYYISVILLHVFPALFVDLLLRIAGHSPILLKIQRKIYIANMSTYYFMSNQWQFINQNHKELDEALPAKERKNFGFRILPSSEQMLYDYVFICGNYCRIHLLKENKEITETNRIRTRRMYYLDRTLKIVFFALVTWLVLIKINIPYKLWSIACDYWNNL